MKALTALVLVILVNCFNAKKDVEFRLKALEQEFASGMQQVGLRIRNLEETVKRQETVLYDQWNTIKQLNERLETQNNIIKGLSDGHSSVRYDKDSKSLGTQEEMMDSVVSTTGFKDTLREPNETGKWTAFFRNQQPNPKHLFEKDSNQNSTNVANWQTTKDDQVEVHETLVTKASSREPHDVGQKHGRAIGNPVAFTTIKMQNQNGIGINQNIIFDRVILNDGGGYNVNHGIFTAPVTGYYLFSTTILHPPQPLDLHAGIMHNGLLIAIAYGYPGKYDQGAHTVILKVRAGEQVWIANRDFSNESVWGEAYSSFSGFLLNQL